MIAQSVKRMTSEEYLDFERASSERHEFVNGEVFLMAGALIEHTTITFNVGASLHSQLRPTSCRVVGMDTKVRIRVRDYVYPDLIVVCGEPQFHDNKRDVLLNPTVIIEILSASTEAYDRGAKFASYRAVPSVQEYILIAQDRPRIEQYIRQDGEIWQFRTADGLDAAINLPSIGARLLLADVFERVTFEPEPDDESASLDLTSP
ncbi:MAG: Uma2 family endonuclease [Chloroflexota bacterium]|nr:Uma2 family endonuclease [Chloroflexota bacterium]